MRKRITKSEILKRFGTCAKTILLWSDIVVKKGSEKFHISSDIRFDKNGKISRWRYIEDVS